ncbi:hypothetical protein B0A52_03545 [Exophiala mesophila]|uniref:THO complex subunit 2 n=1 Tax=Exophiala mesophila TaxID=212818 RepID=A0A438N5X9_EXOME|nr:hypothetical protein B0A52_03545 [Exophiala mesophila]
MPPYAGRKRSRPDRTYSDEHQNTRPSPHRPENLNLAQHAHDPSGHDRDYQGRGGRGSRRSSRGGRGGAIPYNPLSSSGETPQSTTPSNNPIPSANDNMGPTSIAPPTSDPPKIRLTAPPSSSQPLSHVYITEDVLQSWDQGGSQKVLEHAQEGLEDEDGPILTAVMHELVQVVIYGQLEPSLAGDLVKAFFDSEPSQDTSSDKITPTTAEAALLDTISVFFEANPSLPVDRLTLFLQASGISPELLRLELDAALLEKLELIRNTFSRVLIRKQTNFLYRQANFNLMREESEGFAKLITELFTTSNNEAPTGEVVEDTVEKVKAMIGAFDLDVGRSLDVVLDVFGSVLVKQFRFFVKFLRASPWWPRQSASAKKLGATAGIPRWALPGSPDWHLTDEQRQLVALETLERDVAFWPMAKEQGLKAFYLLGRAPVSQEQLDRAAEAPADDLQAAWIRETGTTPPFGNCDAAQLLGFKLRFYSTSAARDDSDILPENLIYLSALLIKIGFISLKDLYPHIWKPDDAMEELKQQKMKEKAEREAAAKPGAGMKNALAMAGALVDDTAAPIPSRLRETTTRPNTPAKETESDATNAKNSNEPADQKVLLLKSLLAIGALPEALFILGRFPWLIDLYPELPEYIYRILHHCLSKVYGDVRPLQERSTLRNAAPLYETDVPGLQKGQVRVQDATERKTLRWPMLDKSDCADGVDYRFYWDEWNDNIPVCQSVDDIFTLCDTLLSLVGVKIGQDSGLLLKVARIGKHSLVTDRSESNRARWLDLSKRILLPALSLTKSNAGAVNEVFELISNFPVSVRYQLYLEWSSGRTSRNPDVKAAFDLAKAETRDILKRISNTNVRPMARALAKVAFANPHVVVTTALPQIEVYDSISEVFVEGARYFTDLGYDVLTWAVVSSMARTGRQRIQEGGMFTSKWLIALSQFAGKIYKRYGMMRPGPVLQYVVEQLDKGNTADLKMLEQVVASMGGITTDTSYNDAQLQAMGGGPLLQSQTILQVLDQRHESKKTSERLMKSLHDTGLAAKILISMAQQSQDCVFNDSTAPLKAIGNTYDEVHRVMEQYMDLLRHNLSPEEFRNTIPDVTSLLLDYEIRPEIAFWISRNVLAQQMIEYDKATREQLAEESGESNPLNQDPGNMNGGSSEEDGEAEDSENGETPLNVSTPDAGMDLDIPPKTPTAEQDHVDCWHPVMKNVMSTVQRHLPEQVSDIIGTGFYSTFWQLSLYDIIIPGKSYEDEISRQKKKIAAISADRTDVSVAGTRKKEQAKKELQELMDKLLAENRQHLKASAESKARLAREKEQWFVGKARLNEELNMALMEHCFLPRLLSSPLDAYFSFKFLKYLQSAGTPNFRTLGFIDVFFRPARLNSLIFTCTSKESDNLGRFLNELLKDLSRWHNSKQTYEREAWGVKKNLPGFALKVESGKVVTLLEYQKFRNILFKWHSSLFNALVRCLASPEYMHVRNAISVLRAVAGFYPSVNTHGVGLQKAVDKLGESDKEDLKVSSQALLGALHKREKVWISPVMFREGQEKVAAPEQKPTQERAKPVERATSTPKPATGTEPTGEVKDTIMVDSTPKAKPSIEKNEPDERKATKPEATSERSNPGTKPPTSNGASTPSRQTVETSSSRDSRQTRQDLPKPHNLPRRVSPSHAPPERPPSHLPNRPEVPESRNGHREPLRQSVRAGAEPSRTGSDPRQDLRPDSRGYPPRDLRPGYRGLEPPPYEDYDRPSRRYERQDVPPHGLRDDRGYPRDRDHDRLAAAQDRSRPAGRDRPALRPPPERTERESREKGPRSRPPLGEEPNVADIASQKPTSQRRESPGRSANVSINPERASQIEGPGDQRPSGPLRNQREEGSARSSRPSSPRRDEERRQGRRNNDERPAERRSEAPGRNAGSHQSMPADQSPLNPGPRGGGRDHARDAREPREPRFPRQPPVDMQHGRLEQEPPHRGSGTPNTERPRPIDVPSGPRTPPPPPVNVAKARLPAVDTQSSSSPPQHDRPTPTGPSSRRHGRNGSYNDAASTPSTPDTSGVHPARLMQIDQSNEGPRQHQTSGLPPPNHAPAGPRGHPPAGAPSGPSPTSRGPPPPSLPVVESGAGRGSRGGRTALSAVNNTLAQAGSGSSSRGRGSGVRQNSGSFGAPMQPPPPPPPGGPPSNGYGAQQDLFAGSNPNEMPLGSRQTPSRHGNERERERRSDYNDDRGSERRSSRHSSRHDEGRGEREHGGRGDGREGKEDRHGDRMSRRDEGMGHGPGYMGRQEGDDRRGGSGSGGGYSRSGPPNGREEHASRKHGRSDEAGPYGSGGPGERGGERPGDRPGRGGARVASENKRPRRGP